MTAKDLAKELNLPIKKVESVCSRLLIDPSADMGARTLTVVIDNIITDLIKEENSERP